MPVGGACLRSIVMIVETWDCLPVLIWGKYQGVLIGDLINNSMEDDDKNLK